MENNIIRAITLKLGSGGLWFLCSELLLNAISLQQVIMYLINMQLTVDYISSKKTKGNNSKMIKQRVMIIVQYTATH